MRACLSTIGRQMCCICTWLVYGYNSKVKRSFFWVTFEVGQAGPIEVKCAMSYRNLRLTEIFAINNKMSWSSSKSKFNKAKAQFKSVTGASDAIADEIIKKHSNNVERAVNYYYQNRAQ
eukprot:g11961.t1